MKKKFALFFASALTVLSLAACGGTKQEDSSETNGFNTTLKSGAEQQLEFEENYISKKMTYETGGKFAMSVLTNVGAIAAGAAFSSPTSVVSGIFGILNAVGDNFATSKGPTIKDVMDKLNEMDGKLDTITATLNENYNQLMTESVRTEAAVDKVLLEEQNSAIESFYTNYVMPIENHERDYSDYVEQSLKTYVSKEETSDFYIHKNSDKEWVLNSLVDVESTKEYEFTVTIKDFANSLNFLDKNYGTVTTGFTDRLSEDVESALLTATLPEGLDKETARDYVVGNIFETITKKYYEDNHDKALELRNEVINYAKQISGKNTKSVIDRYTSRLEYMYNFGGEIKDTVTDLYSNIMYNLDNNVALAAQACSYASVNPDEIRSEYIDATKTIQNYYSSIKELKDNYCFLTNTLISGGFYRAYFETGYKDKGNHCSFHSSFKFEHVKTNRWGMPETTADDVYKHSYLNETDHLRIAARMKLMRELGLVNPDNYIKYLVDANILAEDEYNSYEALHTSGWISDDALRFFTGLNIRDMTGSDTGFTLTCNEAGNPGGDYFNVGWTGTFRSARTSGSWSGKIGETTYIDALTGTIQTNKRVAAYATYAESNWYWINDEYWSFVDNLAGNYFFILENVSE